MTALYCLWLVEASTAFNTQELHSPQVQAAAGVSPSKLSSRQGFPQIFDCSLPAETTHKHEKTRVTKVQSDAKRVSEDALATGASSPLPVLCSPLLSSAALPIAAWTVPTRPPGGPRCDPLLRRPLGIHATRAIRTGSHANLATACRCGMLSPASASSNAFLAACFACAPPLPLPGPDELLPSLHLSQQLRPCLLRPCNRILHRIFHWHGY